MVLLLSAAPAAAQVDQARAQQYFAEAAALCARDGGRLWGVSLCGPMVFADAGTRTIATNQPAPAAPWPAAFGFANAAMRWGDTRWSTFVWQLAPADANDRGRLMIHELFHRIQPDLGLLLNEPQNDHLDTPDGRYWMRLEWRALQQALRSTGEARTNAVRDALAFRAARRKLLANAAENERRLEINEGLAQYTGTVVAAATPEAAINSAVQQLLTQESAESFVRTFAYPSGAAWGLLLDAVSPGWPRRIKPADDLGSLYAAAATVAPADNAEGAASHYGGAELRAAEAAREAERRVRVAELTRRFVDGPVLIMPRPRSASFVSTGVTPLPGVGLVYPAYRTTADWGTLEARAALVSVERGTVTVPSPARVEGTTLTGDGWTLTLAPGWQVRPGPRVGDYEVVQRTR